MSSCALRRWGPGTAPSQQNTASASASSPSSLASSLAAMKAEREKQDTMWTTPIKEEPLQKQSSSKYPTPK